MRPTTNSTCACAAITVSWPRAYDDGVCYRFYTERDGELTIVDETAQLNFEGDPSAYIPYPKRRFRCGRRSKIPTSTRR